jgi:hypothetical protein
MADEFAARLHLGGDRLKGLVGGQRLQVVIFGDIVGESGGGIALHPCQGLRGVAETGFHRGHAEHVVRRCSWHLLADFDQHFAEGFPVLLLGKGAGLLVEIDKMRVVERSCGERDQQAKGEEFEHPIG